VARALLRNSRARQQVSMKLEQLLAESNASRHLVKQNYRRPALSKCTSGVRVHAQVLRIAHKKKRGERAERTTPAARPNANVLLGLAMVGGTGLRGCRGGCRRQRKYGTGLWCTSCSQPASRRLNLTTEAVSGSDKGDPRPIGAVVVWIICPRTSAPGSPRQRRKRDQ
jgi:hypothetical protein